MGTTWGRRRRQRVWRQRAARSVALFARVLAGLAMAFQSVLAAATPATTLAAPAAAPLAAATAGAPYDYTVMAKSGDTVGPGTLTTLGRSPSVNNLGAVALVGKHVHGEELIVAEVGAAAKNINPQFSNTTSRHFDESVQINDLGQVMAKDRGPPAPTRSATRS